MLRIVNLQMKLSSVTKCLYYSFQCNFKSGPLWYPLFEYYMKCFLFREFLAYHKLKEKTEHVKEY